MVTSVTRYKSILEHSDGSQNICCTIYVWLKKIYTRDFTFWCRTIAFSHIKIQKFSSKWVTIQNEQNTFSCSLSWGFGQGVRMVFREALQEVDAYSIESTKPATFSVLFPTWARVLLQSFPNISMNTYHLVLSNNSLPTLEWRREINSLNVHIVCWVGIQDIETVVGVGGSLYEKRD